MNKITKFGSVSEQEDGRLLFEGFDISLDDGVNPYSGFVQLVIDRLINDLKEFNDTRQSSSILTMEDRKWEFKE